MASSFTREEASSKLSLLEDLISRLPASLPLNVSESAGFSLDTDDVADIGWSGAFNRSFELNWGHRINGVQVLERGSKLSSTATIVEFVIPIAEDIGLVVLWLDTLLEALRHAGATASERSNTTDSEPNVMVNTPGTGLDPSQPEVTSPGTSQNLSASSDKRIVPKKTKQSKLSFSTISRERYDEQAKRDFEYGRTTREKMRAAEDARAEVKNEMHRLYERERKALWRLKRRITEQKREEMEKKRKEKEKGEVIDVDAIVEANAAKKDLNAQKSHIGPRTEKQRAAKLKKVICAPNGKVPGRRTNWQHHFLWTPIVAAQNAVKSWSPAAIVRELYFKDRETFGGKGGLHRQTLAKWIKKDEEGNMGWSKAVLYRAEHGGRVVVIKRSKTLQSWPGIVQASTIHLSAVRLTGIPIQRPLVEVILRAHINHQAPQLLAPGSKFKMSSSWVHRFIQDELSWTSRVGTRAARKVPDNWEDLCERTFLRISFAIKMHGIHSDFIINADQSGIDLVPMGKRTYEKRGAKNVPISNHEEKRKTTIVLAVSQSGEILPFQSIWGGKTEESLPAKNAPRRVEADALGFTYGHGDTRHWSSRETTKEWVEQILVPYLERKNQEHKRSPGSKSILIIDIWPIHIANTDFEDFIPWMNRNYPDIIKIFIPGGCTGMFQPDDVTLQRIAKHAIKRSATDFMVGFATRKLASGLSPENVSLPTDLPTLRNASISWLLDAHDYFKKNPDVIQKAWASCKAKEWTLSYESLTSNAATRRHQQLMREDPAFAMEFARFDLSAITGVPETDDEQHDVAFFDHDDDQSLSVDQIMQGLEGLALGVETGENGELLSSVLEAEEDFEDVEDAGSDSEAGREDVMVDEAEVDPGEEANADNEKDISDSEPDEEETDKAITSSQNDGPRGASSDDIPTQGIPAKETATLHEPEPEHHATATLGQHVPLPPQELSPNHTDISARVSTLINPPVQTPTPLTANPRLLQPSLPQMPTPSAPVPALPAPTISTNTAKPALSPAKTFLLNVAVQGGTNPAALCTDAELRVTNPRGRKSNGKKATKTGPVDPESLTGRGKKRTGGAAVGGTTKRKKSDGQASGCTSAGRKRKVVEVEDSTTIEEVQKNAETVQVGTNADALLVPQSTEGLSAVARKLVIRIPARVP